MIVLIAILVIGSEPIATLESESNSVENVVHNIYEFPKQPNVEAINSEFLNKIKDRYSEKNILNQYDFVIVGASPSGCVLAHRLTENPDWKVLLLEAGERENLFVKVPVFAAYMQSTSYNWGYLAEPQNYSCWGKYNVLFLFWET